MVRGGGSSDLERVASRVREAYVGICHPENSEQPIGMKASAPPSQRTKKVLLTPGEHRRVVLVALFDVGRPTPIEGSTFR